MKNNKTRNFSVIVALPAVLYFLLPASADEVEVVDATIDCSERVCTISATLLHADTGWDHYADAWRVLTPDGAEIGRRVLMHPHENEQPFTRSQPGIEIPDDVDTVIIEGHDSEHGFGGKRFELDVPK